MSARAGIGTRTLAVLLAIGLALASCNLSRRGTKATDEDSGPVKYGDENQLGPEGAEQNQEDAAGGGQASGGGRPQGSTTGTKPKPPGTAPSLSTNCTDISDLGGSASRGLLAPQPFTEIVVEIDHVEDSRKPEPVATTFLADNLKALTGKPVSFAGASTLLAAKSRYSPGDINELSDRRKHRSSAPRAALWIVYLNGGLSGSDGVLGIALGGTVAALFPDRWRGGTVSDVVNPGTIEKTVLLHEVGHLLSLVSVDYSDVRKHQDKAHGNHSTNRNSIMYWAVSDVTVENIFRGGKPPDKFDDNDLADLADLAACRL